MISLFIACLVASFVCFLSAAILWAKWGIPDAIDEVTGNKRKRQIQKIQNASRAIGATDIGISATRMFKLSDKDEEIENIIRSAHSGKTSQISEEEAVTDEIEKTVVSTFKSIRIIHEVSNLEEI